MENFDEIMNEQKKIKEVMQKIESTNSMTDIAEIVEELDEKMAKALLKKYIYLKK